nr:pilus assembly protein TadG-related protein [uncultured Nocardioides sp.]
MTTSDRGDSGAVAVLVGILAIFLIGLSAFTVDLGASYVSNRNLQKAADAGALAGAQVLTKTKGTCNSVASDSTAVAAAHQAAITVAKKNYPHVSWAEDASWSVKCDPKLKVLLVTFGNSGETDARFTGVFGGSDKITTTRAAEATVDVAPGTGDSVRPIALCSASFDPAYMDRSGDFVRIHFPGAGRVPPAACNVNLSGNWWLTDCPGERTGAAGGEDGLPNQIINGCPDAVSVIPGQADATTPGALTVVLEDACPTAPEYSETCMSGNPGNITQGQTGAAWKTFMDSGDIGVFPVFCAPSSCSAVTASGNGTNTVFPVYKLVSAYPCGYHFDKNSYYDATHANCAGNPFSTAGDSSSNNYFVFKIVNFRTSVSNSKSECALGAECDGGLRRTRLTG